MSRTVQTAIAVKILHPSMVYRETQMLPEVSEIPPRSRLYGLVPQGGRTLWSESLTSYLNRLGWRHGVSPRWLVEQEVVPHLSRNHLPPQLATFCRQAAMSINGNGNLALEWSALLERLTGRSDLHLLTLHWWLGDLSDHGHLRSAPAWCPVCFMEWREQCSLIYHPVLWQYQVVTMCPRHKRPLEERCPNCGKTQSTIATDKARPGECTQCATWLGTEARAHLVEVSKEEVDWQQWVVHVLEELMLTSLSAGPLHWERFFRNLTACLEEQGAYSRLARLTGFDRSSIYRWIGHASEKRVYVPSLKVILEFCYACDVTPYQIMSQQLTPLKELIQKGSGSQPARPRRPVPDRLDRERCLELMRAIIEGREEPLSLRQVAKRLGHIHRTLLTHFPQECALITKIAQEYRKRRQEQRLEQVRDQVRQAVITLHSKGVFPSHKRLRAMFPPGVMHMPEANAAWHAALRELDLQQ